MREISILQQCDHPNIVKLLNVVTAKNKLTNKKEGRGTTHLVFEYMDHELLGYIEMCSFNAAQVKCIIKQVLEGLSYLHTKGVIHRDIKSANILVNNRGEVKIADFGLAKVVNPNQSGKLTQRVVTRWYRAPELLLGCKKYTDKVDMWALGCVFAELLIGKSQALFPAQKTPDQFELICEKCGTPDEGQWPEYKHLPYYGKMAPKKNFTRVLTQYMLRQKANMDPFALDLLEKMLCFNPEDRITAKEALSHPYFQSYPQACAPFELPKIDQECHTYIINNKRKNNYRNNETNRVANQYANPKVSSKYRNVNNPIPMQVPVQVPVVNNNALVSNTSYPVPIAPPQCQYNNYCNCTQVSHIENVNNINVNLFLPAANPIIPQGNMFNSNFSQQVQSFNNSRGLEGLNTNLFVPPNPMELGIMWNNNMIPLSNNTMMSNFNTYNPYFSGFQQQNNPYLNQSSMHQYNQDPNVYNPPTLARDQYQSFEKPAFSMQDLCRMENQQLLLKRRISNDIDEFEPMDFKKRHYIDLVQLNN